MKKILSLVVCASALLAFGEAVETQIATVGVTKINSGLQNTILAVSYGDLESGNIKIENLVKTTNLSQGDELRVYNTGKSYDSWTLKDGKWVATKTVSKDANGNDVIGSGTSVKTTVPVGTGIWLIRKDYSNPFYIYGAPVTTKTVSLSVGWNLVGNPDQKNALAIPVDPAIGDRVIVSSLREYNYDANGWYYTTTQKNEKTGAVRLIKNREDPAIDAGLGFWYYTQTAKTINW